MPRGWADDADRRGAAGVPEGVTFATKPELARRMLERALTAGTPACWVTADEVYGINPGLRAWLETRALPYVLAIRCTDTLQPTGGPPVPAKLLAAGIGQERWLTINAADGAKGKRWYAWARVELAADGAPAGWGRWLLVRRSLTTGELAFYRCAAPAATPLASLVKVAGCRWRIEESFQATKRLSGLDAHQVRCWRSWYRLAMLADAFLAVAAATERTQHPPPPGVIALTCNEIAHLLAALVLRPAGDALYRLRWSWWRRRHQARARRARYQRQAAQQP